MKKGKKSTNSEKSLERDYRQIVKDTPTQWANRGDAFVKFSLYKDQPTIAKPYTTYQG